MIELLTKEQTGTGVGAYIWKLIDLLYPPFCCHCGVLGAEICDECFSQIEVLPLNNLCQKCGKPLSSGMLCDHVSDHTQFKFQEARSWGVYHGPLKSMLRKIKYGRGLGLIHFLTEPIANNILSWGINIDLIVPVALGKKRRLERGYNQAERIAFPIADLLGKPIVPTALTRIRETTSQVGLNYEQRKTNVSNAFQADPEICRGRDILLFDDITTTFSTLNAAASALQDAGARKIFGFTAARTVNQSEKEKK